jgi:hypothetical protein
MLRKEVRFQAQEWREKITLRDVFRKVVKWINIFNEVGDMAVQYNPDHGAIPRELVRFILQICPFYN